MLPKIFTIDLRAPNPCPAYIPPTLIKQGKYCCIPSFSTLLPKRVSGTGGRHLTNPHSCPWLYFSFRDAIIQVKIFTKNCTISILLSKGERCNEKFCNTNNGYTEGRYAVRISEQLYQSLFQYYRNLRYLFQ